jgi:uncharacterized protein with ParB-like and HNH nuclease domain
MVGQLSPIDARERTIGQVLSDDYAFEIPPYQRPYAWEVDQTQALLSDLIDALKTRRRAAAFIFWEASFSLKRQTIPNQRLLMVSND